MFKIATTLCNQRNNSTFLKCISGCIRMEKLHINTYISSERSLKLNRVFPKSAW